MSGETENKFINNHTIITTPDGHKYQVQIQNNKRVYFATVINFSENGRVEGLILNKTPIEEVRRSRPKSAKGDRRTASRDGRLSVTTGELTYRRTFDIESINEKGVQDLFSDILYDSEENPDPDEYKDDFEDVDEENNWSDDSPMPYTLSASSRASRADNYQYHQSR